MIVPERKLSQEIIQLEIISVIIIGRIGRSLSINSIIALPIQKQARTAVEYGYFKNINHDCCFIEFLPNFAILDYKAQDHYNANVQTNQLKHENYYQ